MMDCKTFLDGYSDYRDGLLDAEGYAAFDDHLAECASCARYDRVVAGGVQVLRGLPELEVSEDFAERLQHRLWHEQDDLAAARARRARRAPRRAAGVAVAAAASVAAVALVPGVYERVAPTVTMLPSVAATTPSAAQAPYRLAEEHGAGEGLAARLEEVGVEVYPMPYGNVLYHTASTAAAQYGGVHSAGSE
ncbi:MAG TPA: zf-HC2 domain-containing protein [Longimicrobium sp.]|nr:zf-HC2 domain-containing protein [Longimicrobium sp.]